MSSAKNSLSVSFLVLCFSVLSLGTSNPILTLSVVVTLPVCLWVVRRSGEPPVFQFICFMQWIAISAAVFYADLFGVSIEEIYLEPRVSEAVLLSLGGLLALCLGIRLSLSKVSNSHGKRFFLEASSISISRLFRCYLASFVFCAILAGAAFALGPLRQVAVALLNFKWIFFFSFALAVLEQKRDYRLLIFAVLLEFGFGLVGFFSAFKDVFFLLLVLLLTGSMSARRLTLLAVLGVFLFFFGSIWSAIKVDYRDFLNQGEKQQVVLVPVSERFSKLGELISDLDAEGIVYGSQKLIERMSYVEFFSKVLRTVPDPVPYENGALWGEAVTRVLRPRLLFPSKAAIDDSERTSLYTGAMVAGADEGTSISLGYMAESYIDFGAVGMFVPIFLVGLFLGGIYRYFVVRCQVKVFGFGMAAAILVFGAYNYETSNIKLLGGNLTAFLVLAVVERFFGSQLEQIIGFKTSLSREKERITKSDPELNPK